MKAEFGFERFSVTQALKGYHGVGLVAQSPRFRVYSSRYQLGPVGSRYTVVSFTVSEVLASGKTKEFKLPEGLHTKLPKVLEFLSKLHGPVSV